MEAEQSMDSISSRNSAHHIPAFLSWGVLSGLLYASGFLAMAFLVPIQYVFRKEGKKEGLLSMLISLVIVGLGNAFRFSDPNIMRLPLLLQTLVSPALLLLAIGSINLVNTDTWKKTVAAAVVLSVIFGFLLQASIGTEGVQQSIAGMIAQMIDSTGMQSPDISTITQSYVAPAVSIIFDCFGAALWLMLAGSWWIGNRLGALKVSTEEKIQEGKSSSFNVPSWLLWPSIAGWTLLLFVLYGHKTGILAIIAWNASLAAASWYGLQGFSVISRFFQLKGMQQMTGLVLVLLAVLILLDTKVGLAVAMLVPVLGVSEVWLQYRIHKGA
ncbi:MAG: hypothetical protein SAMD01599839_17340 [Rectinema sp.]